MYEEIQNGSVAKSNMTNGPHHLCGNICAFPHSLGSLSTHMTLLYTDPI
jgi:hypothetical protein